MSFFSFSVEGRKKKSGKGRDGTRLFFFLLWGPTFQKNPTPFKKNPSKSLWEPRSSSPSRPRGPRSSVRGTGSPRPTGPLRLAGALSSGWELGSRGSGGKTDFLTFPTLCPLLKLLLLLLQLSQELGVSILQDLQRQRETIVHASDALRGADDSIAGARRILGVMSRRVAANKMIAWGVAGTLGLCVLVILWAKIRR